LASSCQSLKSHASNTLSARTSKALSSIRSLSGFGISGLTKLVLFCVFAKAVNSVSLLLAKSLTLFFSTISLSFASSLDVQSPPIRSAISTQPVIAIFLYQRVNSVRRKVV
jgi:hypothetical protein